MRKLDVGKLKRERAEAVKSPKGGVRGAITGLNAKRVMGTAMPNGKKPRWKEGI